MNNNSESRLTNFLEDSYPNKHCEEFFCERERLNTFIEWPLEFISSEELAKAGFIYLKNNNCMCVFCLKVFDNWKRGDIPSEVHKRLVPSCKFETFIMKLNQSVVICQNKEFLVLPTTTYCMCEFCNGIIAAGNWKDSWSLSTYYCKYERFINIKDLLRRRERLKDRKSDDELIFLKEISLEDFSLKYFKFQERFKTFQEWPSEGIQTRADLANAGFYYRGFSDFVQCFDCKITLRNWGRMDKPAVVHFQLSPKCKFIKLYSIIRKIINNQYDSETFFKIYTVLVSMNLLKLDWDLCTKFWKAAMQIKSKEYLFGNNLVFPDLKVPVGLLNFVNLFVFYCNQEDVSTSRFIIQPKYISLLISKEEEYVKKLVDNNYWKSFWLFLVSNSEISSILSLLPVEPLLQFVLYSIRNPQEISLTTYYIQKILKLLTKLNEASIDTIFSIIYGFFSIYMKDIPSLFKNSNLKNVLQNCFHLWVTNVERNTFLHYVAGPNRYEKGEFHYGKTLKIMAFLIKEMNVALAVKNSMGDTPLHTLAKHVNRDIHRIYSNLETDNYIKCIKLLLDAGCHIDWRTKSQTNIKEILTNDIYIYRSFKEYFNKVLPLQCLCAKIIKSNPYYTLKLPSQIKKMIELH